MSHRLCIRTRHFILIYPYSNWQMTNTYLWYMVKCFGILCIAEWPLQFKIIDIPSVVWDEDTSGCSVFSSVQGFVCYKHPPGQNSTQPCGSQNSCDQPSPQYPPASLWLCSLCLWVSWDLLRREMLKNLSSGTWLSHWACHFQCNCAAVEAETQLGVRNNFVTVQFLTTHNHKSPSGWMGGTGDSWTKFPR